MNLIAHTRGFALLLVLITLVLVTTMAILFLVSIGRERRGVDTYARGSEVSTLADMAVNRVMGQINAATKEGTASNPVSWASQPGMVRTYGSDGKPANIYKLYSWDGLMESGTGFNPLDSAQIPPSTWAASPAHFTDLNQRVNDVYPIVDPRVEGIVEGFSIAKTGPVLAPDTAPMPVKWLYVLEDGRAVAPSTSSGNTASIPGATTTNPIVGRIAYWTDDETAKVNLNTASEGAYWDWPKAATYDEMQFASNPPVGGEYNRTPGHPAMTSLSAVFPEINPGLRWTNVSDYRTKLSSLLALIPRVPYSEASSRGGTYPVEVQAFNYGPTGALPAIPNASLTLKSDRLFASPDELLFNYPTRSLPASLNAEMVSRRAFFLTSQSRAPETTLFETPRISLWPITWPYASAHASLPNRQTAAVSAQDPNTAPLSANTWMRAEERLLAFVSTGNQRRTDGGDKYYFQRQNPESPTYDYASIQRNRELLTYLQNLTSKSIPGYGGNFSSKFTSAARDAILANSFNVSRSLVNQYTLQNDGKMLYSFTPVAFTKFTPPTGAAVSSSESGAFCPIPMKLNLGSGDIVTLSEFPVLREAALAFYATRRIDPVAPDVPATLSDAAKNKIKSNPWNWQNLINLDAANGYPVGARTTEMRAVLVLDFAPLRGSTRNNQPVFWVKISGGSLSASGTALGFGNAVAKMDFRAVGNGRNIPSYLLPFFQKDAAGGQPTGVKTLNHGDVSNTNYGLISMPVVVDPAATQFNFSGGSVNIEIYGIKNGNPDLDPTSDSSLLLTSSQLDFSKWNGSHGIPLAPRWNYYELKSETPQYFPNPNYQAFDATRPTKWAALEIAPPYRTGTSIADPALTSSPAAVSPYTSLYRRKTPDDGSILVPTSMTALGTSVLYAKRDANGELMTDFSKRLSFIKDTGATVASTADNGGFGGALNSGNLVVAYSSGGFPAITVYDTVLSMIADPQGPGNGDPRLGQKFEFAPANTAVGAGVPLREVMALADYPRINRQYHTLGTANQKPSATGYVTLDTYSLLGKGVAPTGMAIVGATSLLGRLGWANNESDATSVGVVSALPRSMVGPNVSVGDWSSQPGYLPDGGVLPRADQDFQTMTSGGGGGLSYQTPYFRMTNSTTDGLESAASSGYFSPNRQIPSPIALLGSLPSSLSQGWQTLVFSPNPAVGAAHPGLADPPDHLLLDLFWMPVAEPYPISEEFSTAGKINLNYQILPFSYIKRRTGMHALLKSTWITALNNSLAHDYKAHDYVKGAANSQTRYTIDVKETLDRLDTEIFTRGDLFRSASQICKAWLVPKGRTVSDVEAFWSDKLLTSDTAREEPYNHLYSRVTTKSNTFTVHWRAQVLRKLPNSNADQWNETTDRVASELRGATLIERYLNPDSTDLPNYATDVAAKPLSQYYKWRVVSENFFQP